MFAFRLDLYSIAFWYYLITTLNKVCVLSRIYVRLAEYFNLKSQNPLDKCMYMHYISIVYMQLYRIAIQLYMANHRILPFV